MSDQTDPFYVGYLPLHREFRLFITVVATVVSLGALTLSLILASVQGDPGAGHADLTTESVIEGHLSVDPYPIVFVADPMSASGVRSVLIVSSLKFGALVRTIAHDGARVRLTGHCIARDGRSVFELIDGPLALSVIDSDSTGPPTQDLGQHTLVGEITDSKCFFGAMKPGSGKTHRACAARCIAGGIPPIFVTRNESGMATVYVLTSKDHGAANDAVLPYVAEPVELTGALERRGDLLVLAIDTNAIVRH